ncbi:unnamed protein product [Paramecium sonneborni]|uniref:Uncharacterized protein n=1 Tax=Paramecium sonneborni TaxID=65129 RepID=A0A8S1RU00_9CILI|nr:unnamed protein product [Paramecium sonneborni]
MTFYLFNLQEQSKIEIQLQSRIIKDLEDFQFENLIPIFYNLLRIEMIFQIYDSNPNLHLRLIKYDYESWGLKNITVDTGFCQENCLICSDFSNCQQYNTGFQLHKNMCIQLCPIHSSIIVLTMKNLFHVQVMQKVQILIMQYFIIIMCRPFCSTCTSLDACSGQFKLWNKSIFGIQFNN